MRVICKLNITYVSQQYRLCLLQEFNKRLGIENFAAQPGIAQTEIFGKIAAPDAGKPFASILVRKCSCMLFYPAEDIQQQNAHDVNQISCLMT